MGLRCACPTLPLPRRAAKFNTGKYADWTEGDFNDDGLFTAIDMQLLLQANLFKKGYYGPPGGGAMAQSGGESSGLAALTAMAEDAMMAMLPDGTGAVAAEGTIEVFLFVTPEGIFCFYSLPDGQGGADKIENALAGAAGLDSMVLHYTITLTAGNVEGSVAWQSADASVEDDRFTAALAYYTRHSLDLPGLSLDLAALAGKATAVDLVLSQGALDWLSQFEQPRAQYGFSGWADPAQETADALLLGEPGQW